MRQLHFTSGSTPPTLARERVDPLVVCLLCCVVEDEAKCRVKVTGLNHIHRNSGRRGQRIRKTRHGWAMHEGGGSLTGADRGQRALKVCGARRRAEGVRVEKADRPSVGLMTQNRAWQDQSAPDKHTAHSTQHTAHSTQHSTPLSIMCSTHTPQHRVSA